MANLLPKLQQTTHAAGLTADAFGRPVCERRVKFVPMTHDIALPALTPQPTGLYRHHKGGWYEVLHTARCSETLQGLVVYRPLYGALDDPAWVRPQAMFSEHLTINGVGQPRFAPVDPATYEVTDADGAQAVARVLQNQLRQAHKTLRPPPPQPTTCCGRGCNGCVWEGYMTAWHHWREDALALLTPTQD